MPPIKLGKVTFQAKSDAIRGPAGKDIVFDRVAYDQYGTMLLMSLVLENQKAKQLRAILTGVSGKVSIDASVVYVSRKGDGDWQKKSVGNIRGSAAAEGYHFQREPLGYGLSHAIVVAKTPTFMMVTDHSSLWEQIKSDRFSTPVLQEWVPFIMEKLIEQKLLVPCFCYRCECSVLQCTTENLDKIVSDGLREGEIEIPDDRFVDTEVTAVTPVVELKQLESSL